MAARDVIEGAQHAERRVVGIFAWAVYAFLVAPTLIILVLSFGNKYELEFPPHALSVYLYQQLFTDPDWLRAIARSLRIAIATAAAALLLGIPGAYGLARGRFRGRGLLMVVVLSPLMVPSIVLALGLYLYFSSLGVLGNDAAVLLGHTVITTPLVIVVAMAGLRDIDENLERVAGLMGAGPVYGFLKVTLPLMRPAILTGGLFAFLTSFDEVVIAYFVSGNATQTLPVKMFSSIHWEISPVLASAASFLTVISVAICLAVAGWQKRAPR